MFSEVIKDWLFVESWMLIKVSRVKTSFSLLASQLLVDWWFWTANSITQVPRVSCILQQCDSSKMLCGEEQDCITFAGIPDGMQFCYG